uniref:ShKT domain-containing protein n=1 Tax=Globodera rostochiensis TaxID=31243 RepID=A0A914IEQ0_GLORO
MAKFFLQIFLSKFALISLVNALYYCTHFVYEAGQNLCPPTEPPLTYYASVHLCCKNDANLGSALVYRTFETEPPQAFPQGCTPALHDATIGQYVCKTGEDAYSNWDPTFADVIPVCCPSSSAPPRGLKVATAHLGADGQRPQPDGTGQQNGGASGSLSVWPWPTNWGTGGGGRWTPYTGGVSATCRDLNMPGRASDCAANAHRCTDTLWSNLMAQQCPMTCGLCSATGSARAPAQQQQAATIYGAGLPLRSNHIGGGRGCQDWIASSGMMSCADKHSKNYCQLYRNRMQIQCPVTCGFC